MEYINIYVIILHYLALWRQSSCVRPVKFRICVYGGLNLTCSTDTSTLLPSLALYLVIDINFGSATRRYTKSAGESCDVIKGGNAEHVYILGTFPSYDRLPLHKYLRWSVASFVGYFFSLRANQALILPRGLLPFGCALSCYMLDA